MAKDRREKEFVEYLICWLDYLNGRGIIFTDEDLVRKELDGIINLERIEAIVNINRDRITKLAEKQEEGVNE
tara:strand:+ start:76 stop:291 length:216 start_codon:yes stop_codon:yes gene_type:complete